MPGTRGPVPVPVKNGTRDLTQEILDKLDQTPSFESNTEFADIPQLEFKAAVDRLKSRQMVTYDTKDAEQVQLTKEGEMICNEGSHEYKVWKAVHDNGKVEIKDLPKLAGDSAKVGQGNAMKNKWIKKDGNYLLPAVNSVKDTTQEMMQEVLDTHSISDSKTLSEFKKRKLVSLAKVITYNVKKGEKYAKQMPVEVTDLTSDMLLSGDWKTANFKAYNFDALGADQHAGALHPIGKVKKEFRDIFFGVGFVEMPTNRYVESGFWNFDTLYVPQQHPARDLQDTFYVSDPPKADKPRPDPPMERTMEVMESGNDKLFGTEGSKADRDYETYWANIKKVHQDGAFGSIGYRYPWSEDECLRLCLRTHTTALTSWVLHRLAMNPRPAKYFSIDRVFRNEAVDATHLAEFHQIEGVIAEYDLTLGDGMGFLEYFFGQLGITNLRFKPAYNPYTEPSMEVFGFHTGLNKWVEIGNSGVFRPEMLEPMGLPKNLRIFGFGLSVERPTMIKYDISNIRDLVGHKVSLSSIEEKEAVRLDRN